MKPVSICWNITSLCNENCKFCLRYIFDELPIEKNKIIADKLIDSSIEKITFAGGEPLLCKELFEIAKYIKLKKPNIILSLTTNGKIINEDILSNINKYFDWITLPIDSLENDVNESIGRGYDHINKVLNILDKIEKTSLKVKINTVIFSENIDGLKDIANKLKEYNIVRWKLFLFYGNNYMAKENKNRFELNKKQLVKLNKILLNFEEENINFEYNNHEEFKTSYLRLYSDGSVNKDSGEIVGNLIYEDLSTIVDKLENDVSRHHLRSKFKRY